MTATFLLQLDTGDDTDLLAVAEDIADIVTVHGNGLAVLSCKPWFRPTLAVGQTPPDVSGQPTN